MNYRRFSFLRKLSSPISCLIFSWIFGFFTGLIFARIAGDSSYSLMRLATLTQVSIVSLLSMLALPVLVTDLIVRCHLLFFIYPVAFMKAVVYSYCSTCVLLTFGASGWLIRILLVFTDSAMCVVLLFWWSSLLSGRIASRYITAGICTFAICFGALDYFCISPFLLDLMKLG